MYIVQYCGAEWYDRRLNYAYSLLIKANKSAVQGSQTPSVHDIFIHIHHTILLHVHVVLNSVRSNSSSPDGIYMYITVYIYMYMYMLCSVVREQQLT